MTAFLISLLLVFQASPDLSTEDEARAQNLMREIRCMVCAGESILDSNADMATDMRLFVRERVVAGEDDREIRQSLVDRFGYEVLLRPPVDGRTLPLWIAPIVFLLLGGGLLYGAMRKRM